ncbi:ATP-binding protein [Paraconexibacter algicola]|uniref:Circadian input-output histidine kinase CikA n=2 Tax=Solirubrobacterales TaxID=588673 RepID=A0A2T4UDF1_9ACTN|nr:ATP-binding protein [Paraconexibacter algicola]PTL55528.1 hybrid sensor histidine kinase/response regulator [Paraconexibacter algicola]
MSTGPIRFPPPGSPGSPALDPQRRLFDALYRDSRMFKAIVLADGTLVDANPAALAAGGPAAAESLDRPFWEAAWWGPSAEQREIVRAIVERTATGERMAGDLAYLHADGTRRVLDFTCDPVIDPATGRPDYLVFCGTDVAGRRQDERRLARERAQIERERDQAEADHATTTAFLANMSHEIRTPMNAVIGFTSLLLDTDLDPQQRDFTQTIRSSGEHLLGLIDDVLDYSKLEAGEMTLAAVPFSLRSTLERCLGLVAGPARAKGLRLHAVVQPGVPDRLVADDRRIRQILLNLLGNAVKFTERGEVVVEADVRRGPEGPILVLQVQDTGPGITPEHMAQLFEPFRQGDQTLSRRHGGTGLGLAISRRLARLMGGDITAVSAAGEGTRFTFALGVGVFGPGTAEATPVAEQPPSPRSRRSPGQPVEPGDRPLRVLVAEDSPVNQRVLVLSLGQLGYEPDVVENGLAAVEAVQRQPYDVVLMDIQMPVMDGLRATQEIHRRLPPERRPRIIAVTAHALESDRSRCLAAGMDDYVSKPLRPGQLRKLLAETAPLPV